MKKFFRLFLVLRRKTLQATRLNIPKFIERILLFINSKPRRNAKQCLNPPNCHGFSFKMRKKTSALTKLTSQILMKKIEVEKNLNYKAATPG